MGRKGHLLVSLVPVIAAVVAGLLFLLNNHTPGRAQGTITFDDSDPNVMTLSNANYYTIGLKKSNGAIAYIVDKTADVTVTLGSYLETLWLAQFTDGSTISATNYSPTGSAAFTYTWIPPDTLRLTYIPDPAASQKLTATVFLTATEQPYFDMRIEVENGWGSVLNTVVFPYHLQFTETAIKEALLPTYYPGIVFESSFFTSYHPVTATSVAEIYPGAAYHAAYLALELQTGGRFSFYLLWPQGPVRPIRMGFEHLGDTASQTTSLVSDFPVWTSDGASWNSPILRVSLGRSFLETIEDYRTDNSLGAFPSLQDKLGDKFTAVSQAPLAYLAADEGTTLPFRQWPELFAQLPGPSIILLSNYYNGGFHGYHPDYLPPRADYGTQEEFRQMFEAAHSQGHLVMPFTLPVWWHEDSPTVQGLSSTPTITDVAQHVDEAGTPAYHCWDPTSCGYNVCPYHAYVQQRLAQNVVSLTQYLSSDLLYEDVIGGGWEYDFNPSSPSPLDLAEGWLNHTRTYSDALIISEASFDRMSDSVVGMFATILDTDAWNQWWGEGNWRVFPAAPLLMHDKILFYNYWGFEDTRKELSLNLAFGYGNRQWVPGKTYDPAYQEEPWVRVVSDFQAHVLSRYTGARMTDYVQLPGNATRSTFQTGSGVIDVVMNWDPTNPYSIGDYVLPPEGAVVTTTNGDLIAGLFTTYNGVPLSDGDHAIIEQRGADEITVRQPLGADTSLTLESLPGWGPSDPIWVLAYGRDDRLIEVLTPTVTSDNVTFTYRQCVQGQHVYYYKIVKTANPPQPTWTVYFDDECGFLRVGNRDYFELGLSKNNGALAYIIDKSTGLTVTVHSRSDVVVDDLRLWEADFAGGTVTSGDYSPWIENRFSPRWISSSNTLVLSYLPDPNASEQVSVTVTITVSEQPYFDLQISVENGWGDTLQRVLFPYDLLFNEPKVEEAAIPAGLPGIAIKRGFFTESRQYRGTYPGDLSADYAAIRTEGGSLALYGLHPTGDLRPVEIELGPHEALTETTRLLRDYPTWTADGGTWTSPPVRVRIGQGFQETALAYRGDNLQSFPSLKQKLGNRFEAVVRSPYFHADAAALNRPFTDWPDLLAQLPSPAILVPVGYQSPSDDDDRYSPDFLPPDPAWGTTAEFRSVFTAAHNRGQMVMPYINPVWWDDNSPTLQNLPPTVTITDVAVLDQSGQPVAENGGYLASPNAGFVQQRLAQLVYSMTHDVPSDLLFEAQVGKRPWMYDFNPSDPLAYSEGWLDHTRTYSDSLLAVERGFDRLAESTIGFFGSVLGAESAGTINAWVGEGNWSPYPLAPLMMHDKVAFYQMWTEETTSTARLSWNLTFGYMLHFGLKDGSGTVFNDPWLNAVADFQAHVVSRYAGKRMTDFNGTPDGITHSTFETVTVTTNWYTTTAYDIGGYTLPPEGALITTTAGDLTAGVFTAYNGVPLSSGNHYLIEERETDAITVRQPMGADTSLTLRMQPHWRPTDLITVTAYSRADQPITSVPVTVTTDSLTFTYAQQLSGQEVGYYKVLRSEVFRVYLPVVLRDRSG